MKDEFKLDNIKTIGTPSEAEQVLVKNNGNDLTENEVKTHRRGVGKLLYEMRFSFLETVNETRELSKFMTNGTSKAHVKEILEDMKYLVETSGRGWHMKPDVVWDGNPEFEFIIEGYADCGYTADPDSRKSVSGYTVFLCGIQVSVESGQQKVVVI